MGTHANTGWSYAPTRKACRQHGSRAIITMSIGARPFVQITRPLMEAYAAKVGADLHVVDSLEHVALREHKARLTAAPLMLRFLKLPLLDHFLGRYWQVLYLDDDTLVGPRTPDLFTAVPCGELGAVVERSGQRANWMLARRACRAAVENVSLVQRKRRLTPLHAYKTAAGAPVLIMCAWSKENKGSPPWMPAKPPQEAPKWWMVNLRFLIN